MQRPNNLIFGRLFDYQILDMIEVGIENYKPLDSFREEKPPVGHKPLMLFQGADFQTKEEYKKLSNVLVGKCQSGWLICFRSIPRRGSQSSESWRT